MLVIGLDECSAALRATVGGKAAALGELLSLGERVPPGFCVTTEASDVPRADVAAAYEALGGGRVAVRSSAPDEDGSDASFAGQYETVLDVEGVDAVLAAIDTCRRSAEGARAATYRAGLAAGGTAPDRAGVGPPVADVPDRAGLALGGAASDRAGVGPSGAAPDRAGVAPSGAASDRAGVGPSGAAPDRTAADAGPGGRGVAPASADPAVEGPPDGDPSFVHSAGLSTAVSARSSNSRHTDRRGLPLGGRDRRVGAPATEHPPPIAVIVQRMVDTHLAGVLFTANPLTGRRTEMTVEAAPSATVVDGTGPVEHYVLSDRPSAPPLAGLTPETRDALRAAGERVQAHFAAPQDIEWAVDRAGDLWLLQSRPITTLFPLPPQTADLRVYLEFGHVQGMLQPVTPMGMSTLKALVAAMLRPLGLQVEITDIGGRLYGDMTDLVRDPKARKRLVKLLAVDFGPRAQAAIRHVMDDPRFAPTATPAKKRTKHQVATAAAGVAGVTRALARPAAARQRLAAAVERIRVAEPPALDEWDAGDSPGDLVWPIAAGMLASAVPEYLLRGKADPEEIRTVLGGMPHNVTIEMDLALWRLAQGVGEHRDLLLGTEPRELAERFRSGTLPDIGLAGFLQRYGHRGAAEVDIGVPRWAEDPAPVFAAIRNYLRVTDPEQAPDRRFARAAEAAEAALRNVRRKSRLAGFLLGRARELAGLRESGKFAGLYRLQQMRRELLRIGAELFDNPADVMFLTLDEAARGPVPDKRVIEARKAVHRREMRRRVVPVALLSDGTDVEATLPVGPGADLRGVAASAGRVTGPARIVRDPATAHVEPGEVLVTATTDPGWTPLFLTAAALVTETGAVMAHGPTVAREYGIPAVICVPGATERIRTGEIVTVDGRAGTVTRG
ncbi:PEP/pyruvate-binding domain-containing protein [Paractinoplanes deccanensis]|uniref:PEP/pyruvate-binding domain-containing protein n=1 Tax=Paractinoplanes deccanensis TaxID=113561 RepID=UPI001EF2F33C|nr:PEP/pyruvate-binding domain-containing protein [Actinoplanes deccanensis]